MQPRGVNVHAVSESNGLVAAVSAAVVDAGRVHEDLIRSIVEVARAIFGASASSIFLLDEATDELVFEAVAGEGAGVLPGRRFPASRGIVGWVLASHEPVMVSDLSANATFARDIAESTGYVPRSLMAAPLLGYDEALGVLEVLDYTPCPTSTLQAMDLLMLFAKQAATALRIVQRSRAARRILQQDGGQLAELVSVVQTLDALNEEQREAGLRLLGSFRTLVTSAP